MKYKISKEDHEKLSDEFKGEYTEKDGEFILTVEGGEDTGALKRAKEHEKGLRQRAEDKLRTTEDTLETRETELADMRKGAIPKADVEALEASYKDKQTKLEDKYKTELETAQTSNRTLLVDNVAQAIAAEISTAPSVILPHVIKRLGTDTVEGRLVTRVLDKEGKLSATTIDELKAEFVADKDFAGIISAGNGSGGGAHSRSGTGGGAPTKKVDFIKATPEEKVAKIRADREAKGLENRKSA